jgi:peptidoglycan hydrolase-like protein with peptidoglycan-binding domain
MSTTPPPTVDGTTAAAPRSARPRARTIIALVLAAVVLAGAGTAVGLLWPRPAATSEGVLAPTTATIQRGTLQGETLARGTLSYRPIRSVEAGRDGVVTALPAVGATLQPGAPILWVNNLPTYMFAGDVPAWRPFEEDMSDGPDVAQLEWNLASGGFLTVGPDGHFDWDTSEAIERWQKAHGAEETGTIALGEVIFRPGVLRVSTLDVAVGDAVGSTSKALEVSSLDREIQVKLSSADVGAAQVGGAVRAGLEDSGDTFDGVVREVGGRVKDESTGESSYLVTIDPTDASALPEGDDISVSVTFLGEQREDVFYVPIGAITAIDSHTFGVQVVGKDKKITTIPVELGVASAGNIEISGDGVTEGTTVLVAGS